MKERLKGFALRFATIYFFALFIPWPFTALISAPSLQDLSDRLDKVMSAIWGPAVNLLGHVVFGVRGPIPTDSTGSGDRLFDWLQQGVVLILALIGAAIWTSVKRRGSNATVHEVLRVYLRYSLACVMFSYGFVKLAQFPLVLNASLTSRVGSQTPMAFVWNWMGASPSYTVFSGLIEIGAGLFLLSRRTTVLGACATGAVMLNVFALNVCYDIPVKLFSLNVLLGCAIIAWPDLRGLIDFFVLNRPTAPRDLSAAISPKARKRLTAFKIVFLTLIFAVNFYGAATSVADRLKPISPFAGVWDVVAAPAEARPQDPSKEWAQVTVDKVAEKWLTTVQMRDGKTVRSMLPATGDTVLKVGDGPTASMYRAEVTGPEAMRLTASGSGAPAVVDLKRNKTVSRLLNHRTHWIQESPRTP